MVAAVQFANALKNPDGTDFKLLGFQRDILEDVFGSLDKSGAREVRRAFLTCGRQNGKTALASIICLFELFTRPSGNDICSVERRVPI